MSEVDNVINSILGPAATSPEAPKVRFYRCPQCQHVFEHPSETLPPATCPACSMKTVFRVHPTREIAEAEARKANELTKAAEPPASVPATHAINPDAHAPNPAPAKPAKAKKEPKPATAPAPVAPIPVVPNVPTGFGPVDHKAERARRVAQFIHDHKLNGISVTPVGEGTVDSIGFTRWVEKEGKRVPNTSFLESTDTPESFKAEFKAAQREDSTVKLDAARICELSEELIGVTFGGELTASLYDMQRGHIRAKIGERVEIGAKVAKSGTVIFQVLGPKGGRK